MIEVNPAEDVVSSLSRGRKGAGGPVVTHIKEHC